MNATPVSQKEVVRLLSIEHGHKKASELTGVPYDLVRQWSVRGNWKASQNVTKAIVDRVSDELEANGHATKLGLSKHSRQAITAINASVHPAKWTKEAKDIAQTAALVHGWDKGDKDQAQVAVNIAILSS